jgi:Multicopper oxidase/zinc-finger of transposase IS204/IS1001/IS1096/IS1165
MLLSNVKKALQLNYRYVAPSVIAEAVGGVRVHRNSDPSLLRWFDRRLECSGCGRKFTQIYDTGERAVRDLPWSGFTATVFVEVYRVQCPGQKAWAAPSRLRDQLRTGLTVRSGKMGTCCQRQSLDLQFRKAPALPFAENWGTPRDSFNGSAPGPTIQANEGDRIRIVFDNHLPEPTGIHWPGLELPIEMDGVPGISVESAARSREYLRRVLGI